MTSLQKGGGSGHPSNWSGDGDRGGHGGGALHLFALKMVIEGDIMANGENAPSVQNRIYVYVSLSCVFIIYNELCLLCVSLCTVRAAVEDRGDQYGSNQNTLFTTDVYWLTEGEGQQRETRVVHQAAAVTVCEVLC